MKKTFLNILAWTPFGIHIAYKRSKQPSDRCAFDDAMITFFNGLVIGFQLLIIIIIIDNLLK